MHGKDRRDLHGAFSGKHNPYGFEKNIASVPEYSTREGMFVHREFLTKKIAEAFMTKDRDEWLRIFAEKNVMAGPGQSYEDLYNDPQLEANNGWYEKEYFDGRKVKMVGPMFHLSEMPLSVEKWAPKLGEDNAEVYSAIGIEADQLAELKSEGVI